MSILKGSFLLKLAALIVALLTYNYIHREMYSTEKNTDPSYKLIKLTAKTFPVKVRLDSRPPEGYKILEDQIIVVPSQVTVIGPEALLEEMWNAETSLVDVSESTKTVQKRVPLESVAGIHLTGDDYFVTVTVPIEKTESPPPQEEPAAS